MARRAFGDDLRLDVRRQLGAGSAHRGHGLRRRLEARAERGEVHEHVIATAQHRHQFGAAEAAAHGREVPADLVDDRIGQLTQRAVGTGRVGVDVLWTNRVGHPRATLRIAVAAGVIRHRHCGDARDDAVQSRLRGARRGHADLRRDQFGPVLAGRPVDGVLAAADRGDGADGIGADIAQAVTERDHRGVLDSRALVAVTAAAAGNEQQCGDRR